MQIWRNLPRRWTGLASKEARFRTAVVLGFFITTAAFAAIGPGAKAPMAQVAFWNNLFGLGQPQTPAPNLLSHAGTGARHARRFSTHYVHFTHFTRAARKRQPAPASRLAICVRRCDGYSFPLGPYAGDKGRQRQEEMCHSDCPGTDVSLYVLPAGSDKIEDSVSASSGDSYSKLPDAFRYKALLDGACTCNRPGALTGPNMALLNDVTLRRGDAVMTAAGLQVFHGSASFPHQRADFVALGQSRDVAKSQRLTLKEIERAARQPLAEVSKNVFNTLFSQQIPVPPKRYEKEARRD